MEIEEMYT